MTQSGHRPPNLISFKNWRRPKSCEGWCVRRRDFIKAVTTSAAAWSFAARAQQPTLPVVGFLSAASPDQFTNVVGAFRLGLSEAGYVENRNAVIEYRWAENQYDRLPALAADLVGRRVDVIATGS